MAFEDRGFGGMVYRIGPRANLLSSSDHGTDGPRAADNSADGDTKMDATGYGGLEGCRIGTESLRLLPACGAMVGLVPVG